MEQYGGRYRTYHAYLESAGEQKAQRDFSDGSRVFMSGHLRRPLGYMTLYSLS